MAAVVAAEAAVVATSATKRAKVMVSRKNQPAHANIDVPVSVHRVYVMLIVRLFLECASMTDHCWHSRGIHELFARERTISACETGGGSDDRQH